MKRASIAGRQCNNCRNATHERTAHGGMGRHTVNRRTHRCAPVRTSSMRSSVHSWTNARRTHPTKRKYSTCSVRCSVNADTSIVSGRFPLLPDVRAGRRPRGDAAPPWSTHLIKPSPPLGFLCPSTSLTACLSPCLSAGNLCTGRKAETIACRSRFH